MEMPSSRRQPSVEEQSAAVEKFEISVRTSASAPINAARCESDLSPGKRKLPRIKTAGCSLIICRHGTVEDIKSNDTSQIAHPLIVFPQQLFPPETFLTRGRALARCK